MVVSSEVNRGTRPRARSRGVRNRRMKAEVTEVQDRLEDAFGKRMGAIEALRREVRRETDRHTAEMSHERERYRRTVVQELDRHDGNIRRIAEKYRDAVGMHEEAIQKTWRWHILRIYATAKQVLAPMLNWWSQPCIICFIN